MGLLTPFSLQPQRRGSLSSRLFLAPLGCVLAVFFFLSCFARVNKSCEGRIPWGADFSGNYNLPQMIKKSDGSGCHWSQGSLHFVLHRLSSDLSWTRSSCLVYKKSFWNATLLLEVKTMSPGRLFSPASTVDVGFDCFGARMLSEWEVEFLVQQASLGRGREDPTANLNTHHPDIFYFY